VRLGRRNVAQAGAIESLRDEMRSAHRDLRSMVSETVTTVEGAFRVAVESQERAASAVVAAVDHMRADLTSRDMELGTALRRVIEACDTLVERVRADAMERVIGGNVNPNGASAIPEELTVSLVDDRPVDDGPMQAKLQVQCRFGERWVDGFEILEVVQNQGGLRCAVQRCSDGYVLPTLLGPEDIRPSTSTDGRRPLVLHAPPRRVP
jgi:hypothetical protein